MINYKSFNAKFQSASRGFHKSIGHRMIFEPDGLLWLLNIVRVPFGFHFKGVCCQICPMRSIYMSPFEGTACHRGHKRWETTTPHRGSLRGRQARCLSVRRRRYPTIMLSIPVISPDTCRVL